MKIEKIPQKGSDEKELLARLKAFRKIDLRWRSGKVLGYVYHAGKAAEKIGKQAYVECPTENGLDPTSFPSLLQMENEVISMCVSHVDGDEQCVGNFTSGGTESILMAVKTARDWMRSEKPDINGRFGTIIRPWRG